MEVINVWKDMYMRQARGVHDHKSEVTDMCYRSKLNLG